MQAPDHGLDVTNHKQRREVMGNIGLHMELKNKNRGVGISEGLPFGDILGVVCTRLRSSAPLFEGHRVLHTGPTFSTSSASPVAHPAQIDS